MANVKTAVPPTRNQLADAQKAYENYTLAMKMRQEFEDLLNNPAFEPALGAIEKNYDIKREYVGYGVLAIVSSYLIIGAAAQLLCNIIGFGYPAYVSVKAIRTKETVDDTQVRVHFITVFIFTFVFSGSFIGRCLRRSR